MHSIERYGIVALLFLVVTVVAVLMWDGGKGKKKDAVATGTLGPAAGLVARPALDAEARERRLELRAESQPGPLERRPVPPQAAPAPAFPAEDPGAAPAPLTDQPLEPQPAAPAPARAEPVREPVVGAAPASATRAYTVRAGDTLSEIAQRELGSSQRWKEIVAANPGLDPAKLRVGKPLRIPGAREGAAPATTAARPSGSTPPASPPAKARTWKVAAGENLWRIAERALGDGKRWREIAALNPRVNPDRLVLGQVLVLPGAAAEGTPPGRATPKTKPKSASATLVATSAGSARRGGRVK